MLQFAVMLIVWEMNGHNCEHVNHARMVFRSIEDAKRVASLYPRMDRGAMGNMRGEPGELFTTAELQVRVAGQWLKCDDDWQLKQMLEQIQEALKVIHVPRTKPAKTLADIRQAQAAVIASDDD